MTDDRPTYTCPMCGCPVRVVSTDEGTSYYQPVPSAEGHVEWAALPEGAIYELRAAGAKVHGDMLTLRLGPRDRPLAILHAPISRALAAPSVPSIDTRLEPKPGRWAFLNEETGDWIEVKPGTVWADRLGSA